MKSKFFLISVCLIVGIAATFWLRSPANPASAPRSLSQDPPAEPLRVETDWDALIAEAGSASFPSIMEDALKLSDATERNRVITKLAVRWLNKDRADFLAFLEKVEVDDALDNSNKFWRLIPALGEAFTLVDEEAAFSPVLNDVVQKYVEMYVSLNPTEALAWVEKWLLDDARDQSIAMIIEATAADDPLAAHALLATIKQPYRRLEGIQGVAAGLAENDPAGAFAWASQQQEGGERALAVERALSTIAKVQPAMAGRFLQEFQRAVDGEARDALAQLPAYDLTPAFPVESEEGEIPQTPQDAIEAKRRGQLDRMADAAALIAKNWAELDPTGALTWADQQPPGPLRAEAINAALVGATNRDPAAAFARFQIESDASDETASTIFRAWGGEDPDTASSRLKLINDPPTRAAAIGGFVDGWSQIDRSAASSWVRKLPLGLDRDAGLNTLSLVMVDEDPQTAWQMAAEIQNPTVRDAALRETFVGVLSTDAEAARILLANANVGVKARNAMQSELDGATKSNQ